MRLIDADALIEFYQDTLNGVKAMSFETFWKIPIVTVIANIKDAPTIDADTLTHANARVC